MIAKNDDRPTTEAVGIGGRAREDALDDVGLGGQRRRGEGEEEAPEARRITGASGWGNRWNRWILADDNNIPPPPHPMSLREEGCQGGVRQRCAIKRPSRSGNGSAHDNVPSLPIQRLEHDSALSSPRDGGGPTHGIANGAFEWRGGDQLDREGEGGGGTEGGCQGKAELGVMCYVVLLPPQE